jgi:UDP-N-acetyl-2-amino-2-deoxyglucuronate dehydrogenase
VFTVLQLRLLPQLRELKQKLDATRRDGRVDVELTYVTARGRWYNVSWKGTPEKSGGLALNIGVHFFDLLIWLYGKPLSSSVFLSRPDKMSGVFELERARVRWFLSIDGNDLPAEARAQGKTAFRSIVTDGHDIEFSEGFPDLHTSVYRDVLEGGGFSVDDVRPSIQLAYDIRHASTVPATSIAHPLIAKLT